MNSKEKLHFNNAENDNGQLANTEGLARREQDQYRLETESDEQREARFVVLHKDGC